MSVEMNSSEVSLTWNIPKLRLIWGRPYLLGPYLSGFLPWVGDFIKNLRNY